MDTLFMELTRFALETYFESSLKKAILRDHSLTEMNLINMNICWSSSYDEDTSYVELTVHYNHPKIPECQYKTRDVVIKRPNENPIGSIIESTKCLVNDIIRDFSTLQVWKKANPSLIEDIIPCCKTCSKKSNQ